jgi:hypothetical protein
MTIYIDPEMTNDELRAELFAGSLVVLTGVPAVAELARSMRRQLSELFDPHPAEAAHEHFTPAELAARLGEWKPRFIHDAESARLIRAIITQAGFSGQATHYDLPKPRTSFPLGHLNTGIAYAFPWHRDVWYSAPAQQINWWLPVCRLQPTNAIGFDLRSFGVPVANDSHRFDYYRHNAGRRTTASQVTREVQARPGALDHTPAHETVVLPSVDAVLLFSGAQLHRSIPNTSAVSRYSIDFRTLDARDLSHGAGAPLADVYCTGTAIRDFRNVTSDRGFDEEEVSRMFGPPPADAMLVFQPDRVTGPATDAQRPGTRGDMP